MKLSSVLMAIAITATVSFVSCKLKDADIKAAIEKSVSTLPESAGITVDVKEGIATINGQFKDPASQAAFEKAVTATKDVKSVINNSTVAPPPPPPPATVVISADETLSKAVTDATKDYPTVKAAVTDGVVSLTGEIKKDRWIKLKQTLDKLHPKSVDPKGLTIN